MPKISAPVKSFNVNRGDHVAKDQLLATLENRDLQAAVAEARQLYEQALSAQRNTTGAQIPEDATKARQDVASIERSSGRRAESLRKPQAALRARRAGAAPGGRSQRRLCAGPQPVRYRRAASAGARIASASRSRPRARRPRRTRQKRATMRPWRSFRIRKSAAPSRA